MRLTVVLCAHKRHVLFRQLLANRRTIKKVYDWGIPEDLVKKGIPVYDGLKFSKERPPVDLNKYLPNEAKQRQPEWVYMVPPAVRLTEGEVQAQLLTNSLYNNRLPKAYAESVEATPVSDDEIGWLSHQMEVLGHDSYQVRLPHRVDPKRDWWVFAREYGPDLDRRVNQLTHLFNDYVRLASPSAPKVTQKTSVNNLSCQFLRPGVRPYLFQGHADSATLSRKRLELVGQTDVSGNLPSMLPAAPEMDLKKSFDYKPTTEFPIQNSSSDVYLHTIYVSNPRVPDWVPRERQGLAILQSFAFAASRAATARNDSKAQVVQCVYHDLNNVGFLVYQLNTLNDATKDNTRNEIWHENVPLRTEDGNLNLNVLKLLKVFYER